MPIPTEPAVITTPGANLSDGSLDVIALTNGGFLVSWARFNAANFKTTLMAQAYDKDGDATGKLFTVAKEALGGVGGVNMVDLGKNKIGILYQTPDELGVNHLHSAIMSAKTGKLSHDGDLGWAAANPMFESAVLGNGAVASITTKWVGGEREVELLVFDKNMNLKKTIALNETENNSWPTQDLGVAATKAGGVAVYRDASDAQIYGHTFTAAGKLGAELQINTTAMGTGFVSDTVAFRSDVVGLAKGGHAVVWTSLEPSNPDSNGTEIRCRVFDKKGKPVGADFLVNQTMAGAAQEPHVLATKDGGFIVQWSNVNLFQPVMMMREFSAKGVAQSDEVMTQDGFSFSTAAPDFESAMLKSGEIISIFSGSASGDGPGLVVDGVDPKDAFDLPADSFAGSLAGHGDLWAEAGIEPYGLLV